MTGKPIVFDGEGVPPRFCPKLEIFGFLVWGSAYSGGIGYNWGPDAENREIFEIAQNRRKSFLAQTLFVGARWDPENPRILVPWPSGHLCAGSACLGAGVRILPNLLNAHVISG